MRHIFRIDNFSSGNVEKSSPARVESFQLEFNVFAEKPFSKVSKTLIISMKLF